MNCKAVSTVLAGVLILILVGSVAAVSYVALTSVPPSEENTPPIDNVDNNNQTIPELPIPGEGGGTGGSGDNSGGSNPAPSPTIQPPMNVDPLGWGYAQPANYIIASRTGTGGVVYYGAYNTTSASWVNSWTSTNCSSIFNSVISSTSNPLKIAVTTGTYTLTNPILLRGDLKIVGAGIDETIFKPANSANINMFVWNTPTDIQAFLELNDFQISGYGTTGNTQGDGVLFIGKTYDALIENLYIHDLGGVGFRITNSLWGLKVYNLISEVNSYGVWSTANASYAAGCEAVFTNCRFSDNTNDGVWGCYDWVTFVTCRSETNDGNGYNFTSNSFSVTINGGGLINGNGASGIYDTSWMNKYIDNSIESNGRYGIEFASPATNMVVANNQFLFNTLGAYSNYARVSATNNRVLTSNYGNVTANNNYAVGNTPEISAGWTLAPPNLGNAVDNNVDTYAGTGYLRQASGWSATPQLKIDLGAVYNGQINILWKAWGNKSDGEVVQLYAGNHNDFFSSWDDADRSLVYSCLYTVTSEPASPQLMSAIVNARYLYITLSGGGAAAELDFKLYEVYFIVN